MDGGLLRGLVLCLWVPVAGCSLTLDFTEFEEFDAGMADAACMPPNVDAMSSLLEPNETFATAQILVTDTPRVFEINPVGDQDFFMFTVTDSQSIMIDLAFTGCADLDLELFAPNEMRVASSRRALGVSENLGLSANDVAMLGAGNYVVHVYDFNGQFTMNYTLTVTLGN